MRAMIERALASVAGFFVDPAEDARLRSTQGTTGETTEEVVEESAGGSTDKSAEESTEESAGKSAAEAWKCHEAGVLREALRLQFSGGRQHVGKRSVGMTAEPAANGSRNGFMSMRGGGSKGKRHGDSGKELDRALSRDRDSGFSHGRGAGAGKERAEAQPPFSVAVVGIRSGCGATTVALGLASALAGVSESGAAVLATRVVLATRAARDSSSWRAPSNGHGAAAALQKRISDVGLSPAGVGALGAISVASYPGGPAGDVAADTYVRSLGSVVGRVAPVTWDVAANDAERMHAALTSADALVLVVDAGSEPALVKLAEGALARTCGDPLIACNRSKSVSSELEGALSVPRSFVAVWRMRLGWRPGGAFERSMSELMLRCRGLGGAL